MIILNSAEQFEYYTNHRADIQSRPESQSTSARPLIDASRDSFQQLMSVQRDTLKNNCSNKFQFITAVYDAENANAFADYYNNYYTIGLSSKLGECIKVFAHFCLSQNFVFPEIGNTDLEESYQAAEGFLPKLMQLVISGKINSLANSELKHQIIPNCIQRRLIADYIALLMMRFAWMHEFAHCHAGHVDFSKQKSGNANVELNELYLTAQSRKPSQLTRHQRQYMEFEADAFAIKECLTIQVGGHENHSCFCKLNVSNPEKLVLFSAYAMTWLFENLGSYNGSTLNYSHPQSYSRFYMLMLWTEAFFFGGRPYFIVQNRQILATLRLFCERFSQNWMKGNEQDIAGYHLISESMQHDLSEYRFKPYNAD